MRRGWAPTIFFISKTSERKVSYCFFEFFASKLLGDNLLEVVKKSSLLNYLIHLVALTPARLRDERTVRDESRQRKRGQRRMTAFFKRHRWRELGLLPLLSEKDIAWNYIVEAVKHVQNTHTQTHLCECQFTYNAMDVLCVSSSKPYQAAQGRKGRIWTG